ncbi:MAG: orotidine 5'-phosphate decarboxylase / HUMPS family protein [Pyrodictiaceae archaeon]
MTVFERFVEKNKPVLQVALDLVDLNKAVSLAARLLYEIEEPLIIEAGTPLIKSNGITAVKALSAIASTRRIPVLADMKIADVGRLEVDLAAEAGASAVTVLGVSSDPTILEALEESRSRGITLVVDLIHVEDILRRALELKEMGVNAIEVHVSVDVQRRLRLTAKEMLDLVSQLVRKFEGIVAVAGGLTKEGAASFAKAGVDVIIVGGAILRASDPIAAAKEIQEVLKKAKGS